MNIIERAFQLAPNLSSMKELRRALEKEGYSLVDAHLNGLGIKRELRKLYRNGSSPGKSHPNPIESKLGGNKPPHGPAANVSDGS
jgi:hypothetical protein